MPVRPRPAAACAVVLGTAFTLPHAGTRERSKGHGAPASPAVQNGARSKPCAAGFQGCPPAGVLFLEPHTYAATRRMSRGLCQGVWCPETDRQKTQLDGATTVKPGRTNSDSARDLRQCHIHGRMYQGGEAVSKTACGGFDSLPSVPDVWHHIEALLSVSPLHGPFLCAVRKRQDEENLLFG